MRDTLTRGLARLGLSADAVPQLEAYAALLLEKNRVMNLTAITDPQEVATLLHGESQVQRVRPRIRRPEGS